MSVVVNFSSPGNPPHNIVSFNIERSVRPASGSIAALGDVNNVTKIITVTFSGTAPADDELIGDQMHIDGLLYRIIANTSTTMTFAPDADLSAIVTFPASFFVVNDLAEFSTFEVIGSVAPTVPFVEAHVHQHTDSTGTIFDFYQVRSVDTGGTISPPLSSPFRVGQVAALVIDEPRRVPKDNLQGVVGSTITFEVTVMVGGRRQDPKNNEVYADIFTPPIVSPNGRITRLTTLTMVRVGPARYQTTWTIPAAAPAALGGFTLYPADDYVVSYKANFLGLLDAGPDATKEFASEFFAITALDGPVNGKFPPYATTTDLRHTLFEIDAYLPEALDRGDLEGRNAVIHWHLERSSDKLREEMNIHQIRANSSDRTEYVCARSIYTLLMASRGQNASSVSNEFLEMWKDRAEKILEQIKREGVAQGIPIGRG